MVKLHYIFDPMCGWCYGASSLLEAVVESEQFEVIYHPGGMVDNRPIEPAFRQHIIASDQRIASETKALFGDDYTARVNSDKPFIIDSYLPIKAILVAQQMGMAAHTMLKAIQQAHYQQGLPVNELATLKALAVAMGLNEAKWLVNMDNAEPALHSTIKESRQLMNKLQVQGYPTLIAEIDGQWQRLAHTAYYGKVAEWKAFLHSLL